MEWTSRKEVTFDTVSWELLRQPRGARGQEGRGGTHFPSRGRRGKRKVWAWEEWPEGRGQAKETAQSSVGHEDPLHADSAVGDRELKHGTKCGESGVGIPRFFLFTLRFYEKPG